MLSAFHGASPTWLRSWPENNTLTGVELIVLIRCVDHAWRHGCSLMLIGKNTQYKAPNEIHLMNPKCNCPQENKTIPKKALIQLHIRPPYSTHSIRWLWVLLLVIRLYGLRSYVKACNLPLPYSDLVISLGVHTHSPHQWKHLRIVSALLSKHVRLVSPL